MEDGDDDWMFDSLQKYESLYMYELPHPTRCLDWTKRGTAICVAGFSAGQNNEILQLAIPEKLLPVSKQTLCARRDFKMINGALTKSSVLSLTSLEPSEFLLASCGNSSVIDLWTEDPQKSDMLQKAGEITLKLPTGPGLGDSQQKPTTPQPPSLDHMTLLDHTHHNPTSLLAGSSLSLTTAQLIDINTKQILFELSDGTRSYLKSEASPSSSNEVLHGLSFVGSEVHVFVTCSGEDGSIRLWDTRESIKMDVRTSVKGEESCSKNYYSSSPWQTCYALTVSRWCSSSDAKVAVLGSDGQLVLYDCRSCKSPLVKCCVKGEEDSSSFRSRFTVGGRVSNPCVQFSPSHTTLLSVSGISKGIQVYETASWTDHMTQAPSPVFTHEAHEKESPGARVLVHSWQEGVEKTTIFSADSEGSLHAWEWKQ